MSFARDISLIDTAPLRAAIAVMAAHVLAYLQSGAPLSKQADRVRGLFPLYRLLLKYERYNRAIIMKSAMLSNINWCHRVFMDLGGWAAMRQWKQRWKNNQSPVNSTPHTDRERQRNIRHKRSSSVRKKTDREGYFCWAKIERKAETNSRRARDESGMRTYRSARCIVAPIEIWPHEITRALSGPKNKSELINADSSVENSPPPHHQNQNPTEHKSPDPPALTIKSDIK